MVTNSSKHCLYRRALAVILSAAMVVGILTGIVPGTSITAEATSHSSDSDDRIVLTGINPDSETLTEKKFDFTSNEEWSIPSRGCAPTGTSLSEDI